MGWQISKLSVKRIWAGLRLIPGSGVLLYFNPAVLSECRELSGATSNMILLADITPDCGYLADRDLSKQF